MPVKHRFGQKINEVIIDDPKRSYRKSWNTIKAVYGQAPFFKKYACIIEDVYTNEFSSLSELNCSIIRLLTDALGLRNNFILNSELPKSNSQGTGALIEICKSVGADTYYSGSSGKEYLDEKLFDNSNIKLIYQDFKYPVYKQFNNDVFQPMMSIIDMLFNCGPKSMDYVIE